MPHDQSAPCGRRYRYPPKFSIPAENLHRVKRVVLRSPPIGGVMNRWWLVCLALATGCGGGASSTPTAPAVPLVTRITVSGSDLLLVGSSETFTAAIESGNATVPRWTSDAPAVATVDLSGRVTAVGLGTATISADTNGVRGTKSIRTLPNFAGSWKGVYQQMGCDADGEFVHMQACDSFWELGRGITRMTLTQDGATVSGAFDLGPYIVSGSVSPDGILSLTGMLTGTFTRRLQSVRFESTRDGEMSGSFEELTTSATGSLRMRNELRDMTRSREQ